MTGGRGPDAVIDAVGMEAHGSPGAGVAHKLAGLLPERSLNRSWKRPECRSSPRFIPRSR
jgi:hypothetical protein